jgi:hypothetical protein
MKVTNSNFFTLLSFIMQTFSSPMFVQDGSEIHPGLKGICFNFWSTEGVEMPILVNFNGTSQAGWATHLTGLVIYGDFTQAKNYLREKASTLAVKA